LRETEGHSLVTTGIYKHIRHPGYLSDFMIFIGAAMAMGNLIPLVLIPVTFTFAYAYRIKIKKKMLIEIFGDDYVAYQKVSKRLIPYII
jgi:protein-S-isoprenylcysteine O-methyltransferase Ste14